MRSWVWKVNEGWYSFFGLCFFVISSFNIIFIQKISFFVFFNFFSISLLWSPEMECRFDRLTQADSILIVMVTYLSCYLMLIRHVLFLFFFIQCYRSIFNWLKIELHRFMLLKKKLSSYCDRFCFHLFLF